MKEFEYKVITIPAGMAPGAKDCEKTAEEFEDQLNELGADGWELILQVNGFFIFKREALDAFDLYFNNN